jgi:hypothetical protein
MISDTDIKQITSELLQESFLNYFLKTQKETKHLILDRFFPSERRTTSTMTGLQTSLGTFWEKLAKKLAKQQGFEILDNSILVRPSPVPQALSVLITKHKKIREDEGGELTQFKQELNDLYPSAGTAEKYESMTKGKGSDLILSKDGKVYLYDIKTVQINANSGNSFNETLILWTAYYKFKNDIAAENIFSRLVFPYNSANELNDLAWWNNFGQRVAPLTKKDVQVGNEFWEFITGNPNALNAIIAAIDELKNDNNFIDFYKQVFECDNYQDLVAFTTKVKEHEKELKIDLIKKKFSVEISPYEKPINLNKKYEWRHGDGCIFKEWINKLFKENEYVCPSCKQKI